MGKKAAVIIADDLTGACDAASAFALRGLDTTVVCCTPSADSSHEVIALSTETRDQAIGMQQQALQAAKFVAQCEPSITMKKVDSVFRGNSFQEIQLWRQLLPEHVAAIVPAFPAVGRFVRGGTLLAGDKTLDLKQQLQLHGIDCKLIPSPSAGSEQLLDEVRISTTQRNRPMLFDAGSHRDIAEIVDAVERTYQRILWIGSGGLAAALAARLPDGVAKCEKPQREGINLFCIGSDHVVCCRQVEMLQKHANIVELNAGRDLDRLKRETLCGQDVLVRIPYGYDNSNRLHDALKQSLQSNIAALVLSGGSTAAKVCAALGVETINIGGEVLPGMPWGTLCGGVAHGLPVITKSGGFGEPDALILAASFFRRAKREIDVYI